MIGILPTTYTFSPQPALAVQETSSVVVLMAATSPWSHLVIEYLKESGFLVHVVDFNRSTIGAKGTNRQVEEESISALRARVDTLHLKPASGSFASRALSGARTLRRIAREHDVQVVLTLYGGLHAAIAWLSGIRPYVVYAVGSDVLLAEGSRRIISRLALGRASIVLANGQHLADRTRELAPNAHVERLYLGIDLERFRRMASPSKTPLFVCSRAFSAVYDNATIVRAVGKLQQLPPSFALTFLSAGPLLAETIALADSRLRPEVRQRVSFIGGVSDEGMVSALRAATFYISASHSDGASASLLEAMASGLFPILSDIPANREWVVSGENGLLFKPGDHHALANCMEQAFEMAPWMQPAVKANAELVAARADVKVNLRRLGELILRARPSSHVLGL